MYAVGRRYDCRLHDDSAPVVMTQFVHRGHARSQRAWSLTGGVMHETTHIDVSQRIHRAAAAYFSGHFIV